MATKKQTEQETSVGFTSMLEMLTCPQAFPATLPADVPISVIQTHASAVLLTPRLVYKLKKPENFGFFDYSTPARRRHFCQQEVHLNRRLAPHIYLGIAPVLLLPDGQFRFGPLFPPEQLPLPGVHLEDGTIVDYAVVMRRLPDTATLEYWVSSNTATPELLVALAHSISAFHMCAASNGEIAHFGSVQVIRQNWEENFTQMQPYVGRTLDQRAYQQIRDYISSFLDARQPLFAERRRERRIRDCHGDLRLPHVYMLDHPDVIPSFAILDCIEFNDRFRYGDVASEVAFLTMELDAAGRSDLARAFVDAYVAQTGDGSLREVLPFYACYRACVRGKVFSFQLNQPEVLAAMREHARQQASALFALALHYAHSPVRPTVIMIGGLMGTGKSTLAARLQQELGWPLVSTDVVRKRLTRQDLTQPQPEAYGEGIYSATWNERTYLALQEEMLAYLANGHAVLLDASFGRRSDRLMIVRAAVEHGATVLFVECRCPRKVALQRLALRWEARVKKSDGQLYTTSLASDGRPELYDAQCAAWEAPAPNKEQDTEHLVVSTTDHLWVSVERVLETMKIPQLLCWLQYPAI